MSWPIRVRPKAELDLRTAAAWYEAQRAGLGYQFLHELEKLMESLADRALLYPQRFKEVRLAFAHRFPYAVYFRLHGQCVVVLRVLHMRRKPIE